VCELPRKAGAGETVTDGVSVGHSYTDTGSEGIQEAGSVKTNTITLGKDVTPEEAYMNGLDIPEPKDALATLWNSTAEFHERFDTIHDKEHPFIPAQYRAFMEEVAEFSIEVLGSEEFGGDVEAIERELTDVIVVGMGLLMAHGRSLEDLCAAMRHVAQGNDAKTTDKYAKNAKGKVAKKPEVKS
jgi:hypothetical protein